MSLSVEQRTAKEEAREELIRQDIERAIVEITNITLSHYRVIGNFYELVEDPVELLKPHLGTDALVKITKGKSREDTNDFVVSSIHGTIDRLRNISDSSHLTPREREVWVVLRPMLQEKIFKFKTGLCWHFPCSFSNTFLNENPIDPRQQSN